VDILWIRKDAMMCVCVRVGDVDILSVRKDIMLCMCRGTRIY
jgi:hypothetical protein